ncbi:3-beta hydroxysteroid dehydrogenase/isomerase family-domain-containing protein [Fimicolochytrium jonesii]|uniref:3-beta hydroxysteroid dehydrogenase/isomerase family-domain-containing protein n=1 Tax=Fimicolochytrium jonesii TaxID=1396493 RepID=UPI0022FF3F52|nr:3-beta hydroxysteroid dehydrogenase/isomerase family-domain-containing protein [Fimicolochytrium jonesii]KAI8825687.1 3-beta hydroxysteroid dehydrogenase/isomerase family-domain-containing protein [Fimicolochytrium jonesii]
MTVAEETYLVIGGGGFVGRRIVEMLLDGHSPEAADTTVSSFPDRPIPKVHVFDRRITFADPRVASFIEGDITSLASLLPACNGITTVIHTAALIENVSRDLLYNVNVEGTKRVVEACVESGVRKLVYTSSASVTYNGQDLRNGDEMDPYCDVHMDAYNETKAEAERFVREANGKGGLITVVLRPAGIFGPADNNASKGLYEAAKKGNWKFMIGDNSYLFDWTYVDNVAHAHILAANVMDKRKGVAGEVFYITNHTPTFFWDVPKYLYNHLGYTNTLSKRIPRTLGFILGSTVDFFVSLIHATTGKVVTPTFTRFRVQIITSNRYWDTEKAVKVLGYKPVVELEEGLRRTAAYWKGVMENEKVASE